MKKLAYLGYMRLFSLKMFRPFSLSSVYRACFAEKEPAIIPHHVGSNLSLVPGFDDFDVLVKSLTVFVANISQIWRKEVQVGIQEM